MMETYTFTLKFGLPNALADPDMYVDNLAHQGCDDALVGLGQSGRIALTFDREAETAQDAVLSAITDVKAAIPGAKLTEVTPDLVGLTDLAEIFGFSRQYIRKLRMTNIDSFPSPLHEGSSSIWRLAKVLPWMQERDNFQIDHQLLEIAKVNMCFNLALEVPEIDSEVRKNMDALRAI
jgi:predicted DNA-binding transcriptional regulator AlpA